MSSDHVTDVATLSSFNTNGQQRRMRDSVMPVKRLNQRTLLSPYCSCHIVHGIGKSFRKAHPARPLPIANAPLPLYRVNDIRTTVSTASRLHGHCIRQAIAQVEGIDGVEKSDAIADIQLRCKVLSNGKACSRPLVAGPPE